MLLRGPVSTYILNDSHNKVKYILFGDKHDSLESKCPSQCSAPDCIDIVELLQLIFQGNKIIDFYIEHPFLSGSEYSRRLEYKNYLHKVIYSFQDCLFKLECSYDNVRFHYIDVRIDYWLETTIYSELLNLIYLCCKNVYTLQDSYKRVDNIIESLFSTDLALKLFQTALTSENFLIDIKKLTSNKAFTRLSTLKDDKIMHRIGAQFYILRKEGLSQIADDIQEFMISKFREYSKNIYEMWRIGYQNYFYFQIGKNVDIAMTIEMIIQIYEVILKLNSLYMDSYLLSRMFRPFKPLAKIKIVYAGNTHISIYSEFLKKYDVNVIFQSNEDTSEQRCIPINLKDFI